jgi:hypothetical protein
VKSFQGWKRAEGTVTCRNWEEGEAAQFDEMAVENQETRWVPASQELGTTIRMHKTHKSANDTSETVNETTAVDKHT